REGDHRVAIAAQRPIGVAVEAVGGRAIVDQGREHRFEGRGGTAVAHRDVAAFGGGERVPHGGRGEDAITCGGGAHGGAAELQRGAIGRKGLGHHVGAVVVGGG